MVAMKKDLLIPLAVLLLAACWSLLFLSSMSGLLMRWGGGDDSYCYFVPFIFLYMVFLARKQILQFEPRKLWPGFAVLASAVLLFLVGRLGALETLVYFSIWLSLTGIILLIFGVRSLKVLGLPLLVLLFIVPAPAFISRLLSFNLRLLSSAIAVKLLHVLGTPAFREGNIIDLGTLKLEVADACSGLRYLFPTILMALVWGYLFSKELLERIFLVVLAVPISILVNALRLVIQPFLVQYISPAFGEGFYHEFFGWLVFIFSAILLFSLSRLLTRIIRPRTGVTTHGAGASAPPVDSHAAPPAAPEPTTQARRLRPLHIAVAALIFLSAHFADARLATPRPAPQRTSFKNFAVNFSDWEGQRVYLDSKTLSNLWADDYLCLALRNRRTGNDLQLLVSWYSNQTALHTAHAPVSCLLGSGWYLKKSVLLPSKPMDGRDFPLEQMLMEKGGQSLLSNFWFQGRGRVITGEYANKAYLFWDAVTKRRTDGALVRAEMSLAPGQSLADAQKIMDEFLAQLKKTLKPYIPG